MEEEKDYISVAMVSNITGKTIQGIYKRIRNKEDKIQEFVKEDKDGNYVIHKKALEIIYKINIDNFNNEKFNQSSVQFNEKFSKPKEEQKNDNEIVVVLREQIDILKKQVEEQKEITQTKDKLIFELNERLAESQRMIDQQQQLSLHDKKQILLLEQKATAIEQELQEKEEKEQQKQEQEKNFIARFFEKLKNK